jgi:hypothetical protein
VVVVGSGAVATRLAVGLLRHPELGLRPVGFVDHPPPWGRALRLPLLGGLDDFDDALEATGPEHVVVGFAPAPDAELVDALRRCRQRGRTVFVVLRLFEMNVRCVGAELVDGVPLVRLPPVPTRRWTWLAKRSLDVVGAAVAVFTLTRQGQVFAERFFGSSLEAGAISHLNYARRWRRSRWWSRSWSPP